MATHTVSDQVRYLSQWFRSWSEYQKEDFLQILASKLSPPNRDSSMKVNGVTDEMQGINLNSQGRPPSLFACQMKLFNDWWECWAEQDRGNLTDEIKRTDSKFWEDLQSQVDGSRVKGEDDFFVVNDADVAPTISTITEVIVAVEVADNYPESAGVNVSLQKPDSDIIIATARESTSTTLENTNIAGDLNGTEDSGKVTTGDVNGTEETGKFKTTIEVKDIKAEGEVGE